MGFMLKGQATIYVRLKGQARIYVKRSGNNLCQMVWQQFISKGYAPPLDLLYTHSVAVYS